MIGWFRRFAACFEPPHTFDSVLRAVYQRLEVYTDTYGAADAGGTIPAAVIVTGPQAVPDISEGPKPGREQPAG